MTFLSHAPSGSQVLQALSKMEVLLEFNGILHLPSQSVLLEVVQKEAKRYDSSALVTYGEDLSANYLLQQWSTKWECYVTIHGHDGVCDGDRLLLSARPNMVCVSINNHNGCFQELEVPWVFI